MANGTTTTASPYEGIKENCLKSFLSKDAFFGSLKIIIPIAIVFVGSAVGYALTNNSTVSELKITSGYHSQEIEKLNKQVNEKLDLIIGKMNEQERQDNLDKIRRGGR